jgi:hypothetical protein
MEINYMLLVHSAIGFFISCFCIKTLQIFVKKYIVDVNNDNDVKAMNKIFSGSYFLLFLAWLVFAVVTFTLNPIIHNEEQEVIAQTFTVDEIEQQNINAEKIKSIKHKPMEEKIYEDLEKADKKSADEYEKFLKSNMQ